MRQMIELGKIDGLLEDFKKFKHRGEKFSDFIRCSKAIESDGSETYDWDWVDSVGIVMKEDFEGAFKKEFVEEHFEELAYDWFRGIEGQVDFGIVLNCVAENWKDGKRKDI